jgi:O-antigen/teichoic acid export membrane protein
VIQASYQETTDDDKSIWQRLRRNVSIGVLGSGLSGAIKFAQAVLLIRCLPIDDYGRVLIVLNLFMFLDSFFGLRVSDVMFRFFQPLREQGQKRAVRNLLLFCLGICLASGLLICIGTLCLSPLLAARLYSNPGLSTLFNIYSVTVLFSAFSGFYEPLLRIHDRFSAIVAPQVLGGLVTLTILIAYILSGSGTGYDLRVIVIAFALGALIQTVPAFLLALRFARPYLLNSEVESDAPGLPSHRRNIIR